jgi:hypothetical protein
VTHIYIKGKREREREREECDTYILRRRREKEVKRGDTRGDKDIYTYTKGREREKDIYILRKGIKEIEVSHILRKEEERESWLSVTPSFLFFPLLTLTPTFSSFNLIQSDLN